MFASPAGGRVWLNRMRAHGPESAAHLVAMYRDIIGGVPPPARVVSLGPGGNDTDRRVFSPATPKERSKDPLEYIPVDISSLLLQAALEQTDPGWSIPTAIHGDVEGGIDFLASALGDRMSRPGGATLVSALGNMFGNADLGERTLGRNLAHLLRPGDLLLISVAVGTFEQALADDLPEALRDLEELLAAAISFIGPEPFDQALNALASRVVVQLKGSEIDDGTSLEYRDTVTGRALLTIRRYRPQSLISWFERSFPVKLRASNERSTAFANVNMGVFLFARR